MIGVDEAVIRGVRLIEHWETRGMFLPWKIAAVDNGPAQGCSVPTHELGERIYDNIGPVLDWPQQDRRSHRVVDDQRNSLRVRHTGQSLDIADISRRITHTLTEDCA